jgi:F0F1-type ATP synthase membrane subunit b/b'
MRAHVTADQDALAIEQTTHADFVREARAHVASANREAARLIDEAQATATAILDAAREQQQRYADAKARIAAMLEGTQ